MISKRRRILERAEANDVIEPMRGEGIVFKNLHEDELLTEVPGGYAITQLGRDELDSPKKAKLPKEKKPRAKKKKAPTEIEILRDCLSTARTEAEGWRQVAEKHKQRIAELEAQQQPQLA